MLIPYGAPNRGFSPLNLPRMLLVFAILLGFIALLAPLSRKLFMAEEGDLKSFAGSVQRAPTQDSKGLIRIRVETSDGPHDLLVEDRSHYQQIINLQAGDYVTARAQSLLGEYHIWELKHDGVTIESYQDMCQFSARKLEQGTTSALWIGFLASICLVAAIVLRMFFGVWSQPVEKSVLGAPIIPPDDLA